MMPDKPSRHVFLDIEQIITDRPIGAVYQTVLNWVAENGVKVKKQTPPLVIIATHGSLLTFSMNPIKNKKDLHFFLTEDGEDTILRIIVEPPWYDRYHPNIQESRRQYGEFIARLWRSLGVESPEVPVQLDSPEVLVKEATTLMRNCYLSIIAIVVAFFWETLGNALFFRIDWMEYVATISGVSAVFSYWGARQTRKRLNSIDHGLDLKKYPNMILMVVTILAIIGLIGVEYYVLSNPYTTYSKHDVSFTHNRFWRTEEAVFPVAGGLEAVMVQFNWESGDGSITWIDVPSDSEYDELAAIQGGLAEVEQGFIDNGIDYEIVLSDLAMIPLNDHLLYYYQGTLTFGSEVYNMVYGSFYCDSSRHGFAVFFLLKSLDQVEYVNALIDSIECH